MKAPQKTHVSILIFSTAPGENPRLAWKGSLGTNFVDKHTHGLASHGKKKMWTMWFVWGLSESIPEEPCFNSHFQHHAPGENSWWAQHPLSRCSNHDGHSFRNVCDKKVLPVEFFVQWNALLLVCGCGQRFLCSG